MAYRYTYENGLVTVKTNTKKFIAAGIATVAMVMAFAVPTFAVSPGAAVKNANANPNACWGQDRSYYASSNYFPENQSLNQSFPGDLDAELHAWTDTYCVAHGPNQ